MMAPLYVLAIVFFITSTILFILWQCRAPILARLLPAEDIEIGVELDMPVDFFSPTGTTAAPPHIINQLPVFKFTPGMTAAQSSAGSSSSSSSSDSGQEPDRAGTNQETLSRSSRSNDVTSSLQPSATNEPCSGGGAPAAEATAQGLSSLLPSDAASSSSMLAALPALQQEQEQEQQHNVSDDLHAQPSSCGHCSSTAERAAAQHAGLQRRQHSRLQGKLLAPLRSSDDDAHARNHHQHAAWTEEAGKQPHQQKCLQQQKGATEQQQHIEACTSDVTALDSPTTRGRTSGSLSHSCRSCITNLIQAGGKAMQDSWSMLNHHKQQPQQQQHSQQSSAGPATLQSPPEQAEAHELQDMHVAAQPTAQPAEQEQEQEQQHHADLGGGSSSSSSSSNSRSSRSRRQCGEGEVQDGDLSCVICFADYQSGEIIKQLPCRHCYHAACIDTWLMRCGSCPLCKQRVWRPRNPHFTPC